MFRCVEKGREKCHQYWPYDTEPVYYGDIQVTNQKPSESRVHTEVRRKSEECRQNRK